MKKYIFIILFLALFLSACGQKVEYMDQPAESGNFYYENKLLKFSVVLPPAFLYYQTQRRDQGGYSDLEFYVPTNDPKYTKAAVGSYANVFTVRVGPEDSIQNDKDFEILGARFGAHYGWKTWDVPPRDWENTWTNAMKLQIKDSIKLKYF